MLELFSGANTVARGRNSRGRLDSIPGFQGPNSCRWFGAMRFEGIWRKYINLTFRLNSFLSCRLRSKHGAESLQSVAGSYPGYTGRCASLLGKTALDPTLPFPVLVVMAIKSPLNYT